MGVLRGVVASVNRGLSSVSPGPGGTEGGEIGGQRELIPYLCS